jgi:hypothetical protein
LLFVPALDVDLRRGMNHRRLDGGVFFVAQLLREAGLCFPQRLNRLGFVNIIGLDGHVGEHGNLAARDLNKAVSHGDENITPGLTPASVTMSTTPEKAFASGVTISSWSVAAIIP